MARKHTVIVALALAFAAVAGMVAATKTVRLGHASSTSSSRLVAKRTAQLDQFEASLRAQLRRMPPAVPKLSKAPKLAAATTPRAAVPAAQRVIYVRPAPIIVHKHRAGGEHESERSSAGDGGGGESD